MQPMFGEVVVVCRREEGEVRCQQRVELGENERRVLRKGEQEEIQLLYFRLLSFIFVSVLLVHIPDAVTLLHRISILWYAMLTGRNSTFRKATMLKSALTRVETAISNLHSYMYLPNMQ